MVRELVLGGERQTDAIPRRGGGRLSHGPYRRPENIFSALCFGFWGTSPLGFVLHVYQSLHVVPEVGVLSQSSSSAAVPLQRLHLTCTPVRMTYAQPTLPFSDLAHFIAH